MQRRLRLRHRADLERLRQQGKRYLHPLAQLVATPNGQLENRFAFLASKRVGKATQRNRAKRLLREAVRSQQAQLAPGWDCLLIARPETASATLPEVSAAVRGLLLQADLLRSNEQMPVNPG
ncbi:MAG: ribonuclease P protein component [Candidatus Promineifilaceae bacterium]